jgi:dTDP-4-dehydrorhamnose 3,5-epimerase-like enzyme
MDNLPTLIDIGSATDERGRIIFANDFSFDRIKRFYLIDTDNTEVIRAWHGHMVEEKYALVLGGSAIIGTVPLTDAQNPSKDVEARQYILRADKPQILHIPAPYANGVRALEPGTKVMFFSTSTLEESKADDYRFPPDYFGGEVWRVN